MGVGATLPDAELLDPHGATTSLYAALGGWLSVLVLYRGASCPYCNIALNTYQAELVPELSGRGVGLVAISPQTPDGSLGSREKNELTFSVLSDPGNQVAKASGTLRAPSDEARTAQLQLGLDLAAVNADGTHRPAHAHHDHRRRRTRRPLVRRAPRLHHPLRAR